MAEKLTPKQAQFVIEYLVDLNATQAAIRAGYSEHTASSIGEENLRKPEIANAIRDQQDARATRTLITSDKVLNELFHLATVDIEEAFEENGDLKQLNQIPKDVRKAIASIEIDAIYEMQDVENEETGRTSRRKVEIGQVKKIKFWDKNKSLENLARHLKLLTDRVENGNLDGTNFKFPEIMEIFVDSPASLNNASDIVNGNNNQESGS